MARRRRSGATHSFRLSIPASDLVDSCPPFRSLEGRPYPRSLGGKSYLVSQALLFYYGGEEGMTVHDLRKHNAWLIQQVKDLERGNNPLDDALPPHWWHRIFRWFYRTP
jgi:hypothetical protein